MGKLNCLEIRCKGVACALDRHSADRTAFNGPFFVDFSCVWLSLVPLNSALTHRADAAVALLPFLQGGDPLNFPPYWSFRPVSKLQTCNMAIYHFKMQHISRGSGRSATAASAYRAAAVIQCERTGITHDYTRKGGVISSEILAPSRSPDWVYDRGQLWNTAEASEKRHDARTARENIVALPHELSFEDNKKWLHEFVQEAYVRRGMVAQVDIHDANREGDSRNVHAHILLSVRRCTRNGFVGNKVREWDKKETLVAWREQYAEHMNRALERGKVQSRVDHRSFEDRGIDRMPTRHLGPAASTMERRKNTQTRIGDENRMAREFNKKMVLMEREMHKVQSRIEQEEKKRQGTAKTVKSKADQARNQLIEKSERKQPPLPSSDPTDIIRKEFAWGSERTRREVALDKQMRETYRREESEAELRAARKALEKSQGLLASMTGKKQEAQELVDALEKNLADIRMRETEMRDRLRNELREDFQQRFPDKPIPKNLQPREELLQTFDKASDPKAPEKAPEAKQELEKAPSPPPLENEQELSKATGPPEAPDSSSSIRAAFSENRVDVEAEKQRRLDAMRERMQRNRERDRDRGPDFER